DSDSPAEAPRHPMTPDDLAVEGKVVLDWLASWLATIEHRPVQPDVEPGWVRSQLPASAPEESEPFEEVLADLDQIIAPAITNWQHPGWFAFFPANSSPPSVLGELVAAGLGVQGMLWSTSPAATELESHVLDWLVDLLGLPDQWRIDTGPGGGVIQMSASDSTHAVHVVSRERATARGAATDDLVAYGSTQAHSSIEKGARIAGFRHVRLVDVDDHLALRPDALASTVAEDLDAGLVPTIITSAIGTTGTTAVDPVREVGELTRQHGMWHHVDAAYAGTAMLCEEFRHHQDGLELADSYTWNPHKWMFTNFDCNVLWVADRAPLIEALSILPPYLRNAASESGQVVDYRDWHVPLGRRFRALKLWFVLRTYGAERLRAFVRHHVHLARWFAEQVETHDSLELVAPVPFGLVCFRHVDGDEATQRIVDHVNRSGRAYVTASTLPNGSAFVRVSVGATWTESRHVEDLWGLVTGAL
ncbi:MAG: pyridoxal-dependent decarboxylase, partial [Nitriliruptorales bacterium]|nr:pyridoxal-dependent decarboxylase [Nitriliruptorales bacterium]